MSLRDALCAKDWGLALYLVEQQIAALPRDRVEQRQQLQEYRSRLIAIDLGLIKPDRKEFVQLGCAIPAGTFDDPALARKVVAGMTLKEVESLLGAAGRSIPAPQGRDPGAKYYNWRGPNDTALTVGVSGKGIVQDVSKFRLD